PAKIAMSVSPMEASRYSSYAEVKKSGKCLKKSGKRLKKDRKPLTPFSLAAMNLLRDRKKSALTFTSLVLSGMMLVGISSLLSSLDPEQRAKQSFPY
ncbi:ABC transporter permease, partial [Klebsiella oxytoca]